VHPRLLRRSLALATSVTIVLTACSGASDEDAIVQVPGAEASARTSDDTTPATAADATPETTPETAKTTSEASDAARSTASSSSSDPTTTGESTTSSPPTSAAASSSSSSSSSTTTSSTTTSSTTTTVPEPDLFAPECVHEVRSGDSLGKITDSYDDETITVANVRAENSIEGETIYPGQLLDICVDNGLDDITGSERGRNAAVLESEGQAAVKAQQEKLNELFAGLGIRDLLVDGISGPVTRQRLCAARLGLGLPVTLTDMEPGSDEEKWMMNSGSLNVPFTSAAQSPRWILIDRTCQIMFVGSGTDQVNFVFPTSTGEEGFETRDQDRSRAFRFDPALDNDGWHNSTDYPATVDNPLNGNMYKPLYFDGGQAIHGANNVPTSPQSKGCARLRPSDQDTLIEWLGLADADGPTNSADRINVTVNVQGEYAGSS
jgi:LysM repeat protein